jgi:hypothetical protein
MLRNREKMKQLKKDKIIRKQTGIDIIENKSERKTNRTEIKSNNDERRNT